MTKIEVPINLLHLPSPWYITSWSNRLEYVDALNGDKRTFEKALVALERSLAVLSHYEYPEGKSIPEEMTEYWNFTAEAIADKIPSLDDFESIKVKEVFREQGVESVSELMIEEACQKWFWTVARDIASGSIAWLRKAMRDCQDTELSANYLAIASHYWQLPIPNGLTVSLIGASDTIAGEKAIPLLEEVEQNSQDKELADMARSYKRLMLDPNYG